MSSSIIQDLFNFEVGAPVTYNKDILQDRTQVEEVLHKFKTNQKLNTDEKKILQAETSRILAETPDDEALPVLHGRKFTPMGYTLASAMVMVFNSQGEKNKDGKKNPYIIDTHKLQLDVFDNAKKKANYDYPFGARGFEIVDMREAFLEWHEFNEYFDCYFLKTAHGSPYRAWFHKDYKGIVRYYTVNPYEENLSRYAFDAIDLYGAAMASGKILNHDKKQYKRNEAYAVIRKQQHVIEELHVHNERERLDKVQRLLNKRISLVSKDNSATMQAVLNILIEEAKERTFQEAYFTNDDRTLFFMSTNELVRRVKEKHFMNEDVKQSKTTLNNALNVLSALGFIEKLTDTDLYNHTSDMRLVERRFEYAKKEIKNPISYYVINDVPSAYWIEKQVQKMIAKRLTLHNVTEKRFKRAFGPELTKQIFVNEDNTKKKDKYINEKNEYVRLFLMEIRENGFVTKEKMDTIHSIPTQNVANKLWTELTTELRGYRFVRTTQALRDTLDIDTKGAVFISTALAHPNSPTYTPHKSIEEELNDALTKEYDELITEVLSWYGDIFKMHTVPKHKKYVDDSLLTITVEELKQLSTTRNAG